MVGKRRSNTPRKGKLVKNDTGHRCLVRIGTRPTVVRVRWHDGELVDIRTKLESSDHSSHSAIEDELINMLPFELELLDLEASLTVFDEIFGEDLEALRVSAGVASSTDLFDQSTGLLSRYLNGIGPLFPVYVPLVLPQRSNRPPVKRLLRPSKPMDIRLSLNSKKASRLKGQIEIEMPKEALNHSKESSKGKVKSHRQTTRSLALLLAIQWDATSITLRYRESYARLRLHPGRVAFRFDSNLIRVDRDRQLPFTQVLRADFDIYAHPGQRMSTAVLRRIISNIVGLNGNRSKSGLLGVNGLKGLRELVAQLPQKVIQLEIAIDKQAGKERRKLVQRSVKLRKMKQRKVHGLEMPAVPSKKTDIKSYINMATLMNVSKMALERYGKSRGSGKSSSSAGLAKSLRKLSWSAIIEPGPHPSGPIVDIPCLFPRLCRDEATLRKPLERRELASVRIYIRRIFQQLSDLAADLVVMGLDKLDLDRHPSALRLTIRVPSMHLAMCINDIDLFEVQTQKLKLKRLTALNYPGLKPVRKERHRQKSVKRDLAMVEALVQFGRHPQEITDILHPIIFDPTFAIVFDSPVQYARHGRPLYVHYSPMALSLSTERVVKASLLSTLISMGMPERPLSPMISKLDGFGVEMNLVGTETSQMQIKIGGIRLLQPIPGITALIDQPIVVTMEFRGYTFLRVSLGKRLLLRHGYNVLEPLVTISKTAFGQLSPGQFSQDFADFMSCVIFGQSCQITLHVRIGRQQSLRLPLWFPKRAVSLAIFDAEQSDINVWDVHDAQRHLKKAGKHAHEYGRWAWQQLSNMMRNDPNRTWNNWFHSWFATPPADGGLKQHHKRTYKGFLDSDEDDADHGKDETPLEPVAEPAPINVQLEEAVQGEPRGLAAEGDEIGPNPLPNLEPEQVPQHEACIEGQPRHPTTEDQDSSVPIDQEPPAEPVQGRTWGGYAWSYLPEMIKRPVRNWFNPPEPSPGEQPPQAEKENPPPPTEQVRIEDADEVDDPPNLNRSPEPSPTPSPSKRQPEVMASISQHMNDPPDPNVGAIKRIADGQWLDDAGKDERIADRRIRQRQLLIDEGDDADTVWDEPDAEATLQRLLEEEEDANTNVPAKTATSPSPVPASPPKGKICRLQSAVDELPSLKDTWNTVYYHTYYQNPYAFRIKFIAMILNIRFGFDHGYGSPALEKALGPPTEPAEATMYILPQSCLPYINRSLKSPLDIIRCARRHVRHPPVTLPAGQGAGREGLANYRAPIQIKDARSLARLADEQAVGKHGLCIRVLNSHVTVALESEAGQVGLAEAHRLGNPLLAGTRKAPTPFLLDLSLDIDGGIDKRDDPHADPCGRLYECTPQG